MAYDVWARFETFFADDKNFQVDLKSSTTILVRDRVIYDKSVYLKTSHHDLQCLKQPSYPSQRTLNEESLCCPLKSSSFVQRKQRQCQVISQQSALPHRPLGDALPKQHFPYQLFFDGGSR